MSTTSGPSASLDLYATGDGGRGDEDVVLQGTLSSAPPGASSSSAAPGAPGFNTLDEPIKETVLRDVRAVGRKFFHVLYPKEKKSLLRVRKRCVTIFPNSFKLPSASRSGTCGAPSSSAPSWPPCYRDTTPTWTT